VIATSRKVSKRHRLRRLMYATLLIVAPPIVAIAMSAHSSSSDDGVHQIKVTVADPGAMGLVLSLNGAEQARVDGAGFFAFESVMHRHQDFAVSIAHAPLDRSRICSVFPARGTISASDASLSVVCERRQSLPGSISNPTVRGTQS
jgi:hypothetical protein